MNLTIRLHRHPVSASRLAGQLIAWLLLAGLLFSLAACSPAAPSQQPGATLAPANPTATRPPADTPVPTGTPQPTETQTPAPTETLPPTVTATATPLPLEGLTLDQAALYSGPDTHLPLLGSYTGGITLTVLGRSDDGQWLVVEIPPGQPGWAQAAGFLLDQDAAGLDILPTPAGLATLTPVPMAGVRVMVRFESTRDYFGAHSITYINISTGQPKLAVDVEILKPDGKRFYIKRNSLTDNEGWIYLRFFDTPVPNGSYTLILTDTAGNVIQKTFEVLKQ